MRWECMKLQILDCGLRVWLGKRVIEDWDPDPDQIDTVGSLAGAGGTPALRLAKMPILVRYSPSDADSGGFAADVLALWEPEGGWG